jgi:hypothetical protein
MSKEADRKVVEPLMLEYFENRDYEDVLQTRLQNLEGKVQASKDHPGRFAEDFSVTLLVC